MLGHEAETAPDGEAALKLYRDAMEAGRPFDVVILDLTVKGGMGGEETLARLREIDPAVKAVVSSGYTSSAVQASYRDHGFLAALGKPYEIESLKRCLCETLGRR